MANTTVYPFGTGGSLPSSIGIVNDRTTGGADKAWSAEQGKLISNTVYGGTEEQVTILGSSLSPCGSIINTSTQKWQTVSGYDAALVDVSGYRGRTLKIYKGASASLTRYSFLVSGVSVGNSAQFADGYSSTLTSEESSFDVVVPDNAVYLYLYLASGGTSYAPDKVEVLEKKEVGILEDLAGEGNFVRRSDLSSCGGTISNGTNKWTSSTSYYGALVDVTIYVGRKLIIVPGPEGNGITYAFLKSGFSANQTADFATGYNKTVHSDTSVEVTVPDDAVYLYVYMASGATIYSPSKVSIVLPGSTGERIKNEEQETNALKRQFQVLAPKKIRVCSYNIGHFSGGASADSTITASNYVAKLSAYKDTLRQIDADIMGVCEYSKIFGTNPDNQQVEAKDVLFNAFIPSLIGLQFHYSCNAIFSKSVVENASEEEYECNQEAVITHTTVIEAKDYYFIESDLYMRGEKVKLVMTHLAFDNNFPGVLQDDQISELIARYSNEERVILMGDWNVSDFSEFNAFTVAGYTMANDGTYLTYNETRALDNIIVKGLTISNPGMITTTGLSDHYPFYCDVEL